MKLVARITEVQKIKKATDKRQCNTLREGQNNKGVDGQREEKITE
jgi:hypothetical protein